MLCGRLIKYLMYSAHRWACMYRGFCGIMCAPRKRLIFALALLAAILIAGHIYIIATHNADSNQIMAREVALLKNRLRRLDSQYVERREDVVKLQGTRRHDKTPLHYKPSNMSFEVLALLRNMTGWRAASGFDQTEPITLNAPFILQLLPHLMTDYYSLTPSYHMKGTRCDVDFVIGVPTVKRDIGEYLLITISHLVNGLADSDYHSTLIVVMVGDTDLKYVLETARLLETMFPEQVKNGLIEVLSPNPAYYPDFSTLPDTLGDSHKRVMWRTKQNLDAMYLMAYARTKGTFFLMLEDDVVAKKDYLKEIKKFTVDKLVTNSEWFFIEFCHVGGIGKLFRSADLNRFIIYVQLFYKNMPIDWLMESYLADQVCTIDKNSKMCQDAKEKIRPRYEKPLFKHIGAYSSLKGKLHRVKDNHKVIPMFIPHKNPPLKSLKTDIVEHGNHTLKRAYESETFFWGLNPKKGNVVEFHFLEPTVLEKFTFRSGNSDHVADRFYNSVVEVLPHKKSYTVVTKFDEFGLAEGHVGLGPLDAIRIKVKKPSRFWVVLSEIELKTA